jgi:hypothetical protein
VGPFAPRNRDFLLRRGVAVEMDGRRAHTLPEFLDELRGSGRLLQLAEAGSGVSFHGFEGAARHLVQECERRKRG